MRKGRSKEKAPRLGRAALNALIEEITEDADGEDEMLWAFRQAFEEHVPRSAAALLIGEPISVIAFDYDGNVRRGLTARCRRPDGRVYVVTAADLTMPPGSEAERYLAAYRKWMGLAPLPPAAAQPRAAARSRAADLDQPLDLAVLSLKETAARCRPLGSDRIVTLRASRLWDLVPGEVVVVRPAKQWTYAGHEYLSGQIESRRLDAGALGLVPLGLQDQGMWNPREHHWGDKGEPIEEWAKPIIRRGPRRRFEMERVLPGEDPDDPFSDPILESIDRRDIGDAAGAHKILMDLCQADLRCLDAHAHLGNLSFDTWPKQAIRHYEAGFRIGELSLGDGFDGVLPWGFIDNRPFLRCMHGFGLCLWRLGRLQEAAELFERMLWLNPTDNQGVRFLFGEVRAGVSWENSAYE